MRTIPSPAVEVIDRGVVVDVIRLDRAVVRLVRAQRHGADLVEEYEAERELDHARANLYRNFGIVPPPLFE